VFSFIAAEKTSYPVAVMCRVFGVSRTGFHNWERRAPSDRALEDAWLTEKIKRIHAASQATYGAPRIHAELRLEHGIRVGRKRVARLMRAAGIAGVRPRKRWKTTIRIPGVTPATDLVERQFRPPSANALWVADVTYLRTGEGWLYLAAVQDAYSRQIVGWSMTSHMRATLVVDALEMALQRRRPGPGLIHHSDQGSQYVSLALAAPQGRPGSRSRWAPAATPTTTPSPRPSSPRSRRSSSTAAAGQRGPSSSPRCSSTSRRSTTAGAATPPSGCSPQSTTSNSHQPPDTLTTPVLENNLLNNNNPKTTTRVSPKPGQLQRRGSHSRGGRGAALLSCMERGSQSTVSLPAGRLDWGLLVSLVL
jgi:HTH-like domain/Integrase core domain